MLKTSILTILALTAAPALAQVDPENPWTVNPMPICFEGDCLPEGMGDSWGPYPDEATCLARIDEMVETIDPLLFMQYGVPAKLQPSGCTNNLGESI